MMAGAGAGAGDLANLGEADAADGHHGD